MTSRPETSSPFDVARGVADAVLYEGYALYPYRASAPKNQMRWQFGVLVPPDYLDTAEPSTQQTECLLEGDHDARLRVAVRFLQIEARTVEAGVQPDAAVLVDSLESDDGTLVPWDEGVEQVIEHDVRLGELAEDPHAVPVRVPGGHTRERVFRGGEPVGQVVRERLPLSGFVRLSATPAVPDRSLWRLRVVVENHTPWDAPGAPRQDALRAALVGVHTMLVVEGGGFVSLLEPPTWAEEPAAACRNVGTFPVLVGERGRHDAVLSSPIVLYDHPRLAPESPGDLFDATEIDELLTFRTLTLTEEEKAEARATDPRVRELIDRVESTSPEALEKLHGALRARGAVGEDAQHVARVGDRVRLRPLRRADAHDMFLAGRTATVEGTVRDVDGTVHVAVTIDDDPGADVNRWFGRFHYFAPDEIELLEEPT